MVSSIPSPSTAALAARLSVMDGVLCFDGAPVELLGTHQNEFIGSSSVIMLVAGHCVIAEAVRSGTTPPLYPDRACYTLRHIDAPVLPLYFYQEDGRLWESAYWRQLHEAEAQAEAARLSRYRPVPRGAKHRYAVEAPDGTRLGEFDKRKDAVSKVAEINAGGGRAKWRRFIPNAFFVEGLGLVYDDFGPATNLAKAKS